MKKITLIIISMLMVMLTACGMTETIYLEHENNNSVSDNSVSGNSNNNSTSLTCTADFYDNYGKKWFSVEGKEFSITPNKIKTYGYDSNGAWITEYEKSSIVSIRIDDKAIETCGSTVLFADTRLTPCDIDFDTNVKTEESIDKNKNSSISQPSDIRISDWYTIQTWWLDNKKLNNVDKTAKLIIIQSQLGNPICMYTGNEVSWDVPANLPQTTKIIIDGKVLYIHRANFAIIDSELITES